MNVEVAEFIGQMNFFDARVVDVKDQQAVLDTRALGQISVPVGDNIVLKDSEIVVALRPEKMSLSVEREADGRNSIQGELSTSAFLGDRSHFYVTVDGYDKPISVASQESTLSLGQKLERGSKVWLSWADDSPILLPSP